MAGWLWPLSHTQPVLLLHLLNRMGQDKDMKITNESSPYATQAWLGENWSWVKSVWVVPMGCSHSRTAPEGAFHRLLSFQINLFQCGLFYRLQFLEEIYICSAMGSSRYCSVDVCSSMVSMGLQGNFWFGRWTTSTPSFFSDFGVALLLTFILSSSACLAFSAHS